MMQRLATVFFGFIETKKTGAGTSLEFPGIPPWVKRVSILLDGLGSNGTSDFRIQIGNSANQYANTGYSGNKTVLTDAAAIATTSFNLAFNFPNSSASNAWSGSLVLTKLDGAGSSLHGRNWAAFGVLGEVIFNTTNVLFSGLATLGGTNPTMLDRVRITTANGTDTFDTGAANILYE